MGSGTEVARFTVAHLGGDRPLLPGTNPEQTDLDPQALLLPCSSCGILLTHTSSTLHPKRPDETHTLKVPAGVCLPAVHATALCYRVRCQACRDQDVVRRGRWSLRAEPRACHWGERLHKWMAQASGSPIRMSRWSLLPLSPTASTWRWWRTQKTMMPLMMRSRLSSAGMAANRRTVFSSTSRDMATP